MHTPARLLTGLIAAALLPLAAHAADAPAPATTNTTNDQVVVPQVQRRDIQLPRIPSKDFSLGAFTGTYATKNFGASLVAGLRAGYHITEDVFVEGVYAQTRVSDESFRQVLPGGVFPQQKETLKYYNLSVGYNVLPGEVFVGSKRALASSVYVIGGVGATKFFNQSRQTFNLGTGVRVYLKDRFALQVDMRDHIYALDLLGKRQNTQNLELTGGLTFFY